MKTSQKLLLGRMIAVALAIGVGSPVLAQDDQYGESVQQHESAQDEVRRVGRSHGARDDDASPEVPAQVEVQVEGETKPDRPDPWAQQMRQNEESQVRNAERDAQREAEGMQREEQQGRQQLERQAEQDRAQQQRQAEQAQQMQAQQAQQMQAQQVQGEVARQPEQVRPNQPIETEQNSQSQQRQAEQDRIQVPRGSEGRRVEELNGRTQGGMLNEQQTQQRGRDQRQVEQRDAGQWRNEERGGLNNPRELPVMNDRGRLPERERQQRISQQRQSVDQYRREAFASQGAERQRYAGLQQQNRSQQYQYQKHYWQRQHEMQGRWSSQRFNYDTNPYFYTRASYRYQRAGRYYQVNQYAAEVLQQAIQYGYEEGTRAGEADRYDGWRGGYRDNYAYLDANFGYDGYYVNQRDYNHYFREGFRRGYEDGFRRQYRYGYYEDGEYSIQSSVLQLILGLEPYG